MKIITNSGKEYNVLWCDVATLDGALRFLIPNMEFAKAYELFSQASETSKITKILGSKETKEYIGFTSLNGITMGGLGPIIALKKGE